MAVEKSLEKWTPEIKSEADLFEVVEQAFDYRGDVTLTLKDGTSMVAYIFNRNTLEKPPFIEVYPMNKDEKIRIPYSNIAGVAFTGIDTAAGKSWQAWMEKYKAKESAAAAAGIPHP